MREERRDEVRARGEERAEVRGGEDVAEGDVGLLVLLGVVTPAQLREARGYVIVGVFILAAIITPPDVVSQLLLAIPMCLLYELGIIAGALLRPKTADA